MTPAEREQLKGDLWAVLAGTLKARDMNASAKVITALAHFDPDAVDRLVLLLQMLNDDARNRR